MDIYQIKYFLAIVDAGNFSRAAEKVHVTQPTLSTGIKKLEDELGVTLFERSNRQVSLTPAGELFARRARLIYREMEQAKVELKTNPTPSVLRIGIQKTLLMAPFIELIHEFRQLNTEALIELTDGTDEEIRSRITLDQIDVGITALRPGEKPNSSFIIFEEELRLAVNNSHSLASIDSATLQDIDDQPFIDRINCEVWCDLRKEIDRRQIKPLVVYRAENDHTVISLISTGMGISIMPVRPNDGSIKFLPVSDLNITRRVGLIWQETGQPDQVEKFCNFVKGREVESNQSSSSGR